MLLQDFYFVYVKAEQDDDLEKLEETVTSTKHIALAVNEELTLHTRLLVSQVVICSQHLSSS